MVRHIWAADRMWEGLIGPSDEAWAAGSSALLAEWPGLDDLPGEAGGSGGARNYVPQLQDLAKRSVSARDREDRASLYGELLGTCFGCHRAVGIKQAP